MRVSFGRPTAIACVAGGEAAPKLRGVVEFYQLRDAVCIVADIHGLPHSDAGVFAMHIHQGQSCSGEGFSDTGGHFNPMARPHPQHAGDLPPLFSCNGRAYMQVLICRFRVADILGKTIVIHSDVDDFRTQPAGNAGQKLACGVIKQIGKCG